MSRNDEFQSGLSHEDRVSVAEQTMERAGLAGRTWHVPMKAPDGSPLRWHTPEQIEAHRPVHDYVHGVLAAAGVEHARQVRVHPNAWELRSDHSQAATDGRSRVWLKGEHTNDMTLLHEAAHIIHGSAEGEGHGPDFQSTLEGLYRQHLGEEAAHTFRQIVRPHSPGARS